MIRSLCLRESYGLCPKELGYTTVKHFLYEMEMDRRGVYKKGNLVINLFSKKNFLSYTLEDTQI